MAYPNSDDEEDDVPPVAAEELPSPLARVTPVRPAYRPQNPGRISDDPAEREAQSIARAESDFEAKQRRQNPFIFSNAVRKLADVGGKRYIDRAIAEGEQDYSDQVRAERQQAVADRADAAEQRRARNAEREQQFRSTGQKFYTDPYGDLQPITDTQGRALYKPTKWAPGKDPKTGLPALEMLDQYRQRQFKRPKIVDSTDPEDEFLYADMGDGESVPYMRKADAAQHGDLSLARLGLAAQKKQRTARHQAAIQGLVAADEATNAEVLGIEQERDDLQRQIDELLPKANNSGDTEVNREAYNARIGQLSAELQKRMDALSPQSELKRRQRIARKSVSVARAAAALDAYRDQEQEIAARLTQQGLKPEQFESDPIFAQNRRGMEAIQKTHEAASQSLNQEGLLAQRLQQAGRPQTVQNDLTSGEPVNVQRRGGDRIGGVGVEEFARRYGTGAGQPDAASTLKLYRRGREIADTLANEDTRIDQSLRDSLTQEQQYVEALYKQRLARLPEDQQKRVQQTVALAEEGVAKSAGKAGLRGALSEGVYSAIEGASRILGNTGEVRTYPGQQYGTGVLTVGGSIPKFVQNAAKDYADATAQVRNQIREALPLDEEFARSTTGQIAQGLGQAAGTLPTAVVPGGIALSAVGQIYDEGYQDAKAAGQSDEVANRTALQYLPAATLDYLSNKLIVGRIMKPLIGKITVGRVLKDILTSAASEGLTEGAQQAYLNQVAKRLEGYDPNRPFDQEVYDSMLVGAISGGTATAVGQGARAIGGTRPEGGEPAPAAPTDAAAAEAELQRQLDALTPEERAEVERLLAERPTAEVINAQQAGLSRPARSAEDVAGIFERNLPQTEEGSVIKPASESAEALAQQTAADELATRLGVRTVPRSAQESAEVFRGNLPQTEEGAPINPADRSAARMDRAAELRALEQQAEARREDERVAPRREAIESQLTEQDRLRQSQAGRDLLASDLSQKGRPDGRPPVISTDPAVIANDRRQYDMLQRRMSQLIREEGEVAVDSDEYQSAWMASEEIKNRHGGMPPGSEAAVPAVTPERKLTESEVRELESYRTGEPTNAIREQSPEGILQREPGETGAPRRERGRVEQRQQGSEVAGEEAAREEAVRGEVANETQLPPSAPLAATPEPSVASAPISPEQRANDAGKDLPPVSSLKRPQLIAELEASGITKTAKGIPLADANPAQLMDAVGKMRRGELTPEGLKPGKERLLTERAEEALKKLRIDTRGKAFDVTGATAAMAWNSAIDIAILATRAGRPIEQAIRLALARYKATHRAATEEDVSKLSQAIRTAITQPTPTKPATTKKSATPQSMRDAGAPVGDIEYEVRRQQERKKEASDYIAKNGREAAEAALADKSIPGDTRVAMGGQLINDLMLRLQEPGADTAKLARDIQRVTSRIQPELSTEAGQTIAMHAAIYKDIRTASALEYMRETARKAEKALGEDGTAAADAAAKVLSDKKLTPEQKQKEIEKLMERYTSKPARKLLSEVKRMETVMRLNKLGALTRDDLVEVAGKALGLEGISQAKLKNLADIAGRIESAKNPAEKMRAELELADMLSVYKGVNPLDLESSILTLNILSGPTTQLANLEGNALNALAQLGTTAAVNPTKIRPLVQGFIDGMGLGATEARSILQTGRGTRDFQDKTSRAGSALQTVDYARDFPSLPKPVAKTLTARAKAVEKVGRFMKAVDALFYYPGREAYARLVTAKLLQSQQNLTGPELDKAIRQYLHITPEAFKSAEEQAKGEGWTGIDVARRTSDIIQERRARTAIGSEAVKQSERFAAEATYNQEPEGLAGVVYRHASRLVDEFRPGTSKYNFQALKPWLMFLRVPANVFNATTNFTPMGAIRAETGMAGAKKGEWRNFTADERNRLYLQSAIGTALMGGLIYRVLDKDDIDVTAGGPTNPTQKKQLQQGGWQPYSIKIGGKYYSYKDSPLLVPLAIVGNVADAIKYQKSKEDLLLESKVADAVAQAPQVIFQTSMLSGLADLMESLSAKNGPQKLGRSLSSIPANLAIPYNRLLQQIDQSFESKQYEANPIKRSVPFLRRDGPLRTDVQGRPEQYNPFSRFGSKESNDPVDKLIRDKQVFIPDVQTNQKIGDRVMTDAELKTFRQMSGQRIRARLLPQAPRLSVMTKEQAQDAIDSIVREERARAKAMVGRMNLQR